MTVLDIIVLTLLGGGAIFGFKNGFVQEVLALFAWMAALIAIRLLHQPATAYLTEPIGNASGASAAALVGIFVVIYFIGKWVASSIGGRTRKSTLGPIDRVLGFGFGAIKGLMAATLLFLTVTMLYGFIFAEEPTGEWIANSRTFPLLNASSEALVDLYDQRQALIDGSVDHLAAP